MLIKFIENCQMPCILCNPSMNFYKTSSPHLEMGGHCLESQHVNLHFNRLVIYFYSDYVAKMSNIHMNQLLLLMLTYYMHFGCTICFWPCSHLQCFSSDCRGVSTGERLLQFYHSCFNDTGHIEATIGDTSASNIV